MTAQVSVTQDLKACLAIRHAVFVEEQEIPKHEDVDGLDPEAVQILLTDGGDPVGTARMLISDGIGKIGRVAVLKTHRGRGHGASLIRAAIENATAQGLHQVKLGSRADATEFYAGLGFKPTGPEFLDVGIPHQMMVLDL